jgi:YegS/Rv2252/BmrU family lipid kinase
MTNIRIEDHCWHIILNANANEKKSTIKWAQIAAMLKRKGIRFEAHTSYQRGEGIATAKKLCQSGIRHIVAAGGDGTINEVVNGIMISGVNTREVYLSVLPLGRGNDWVRTHHYPKTIEEVVDVWLQGKFMQHDIGLVTTKTPDNHESSRYFINIAGFGFDADVIYDVTYHKPKIGGSAVYILSLLKTLLRHKPTKVMVNADNGFSFNGEVFMVIAAICQYNGGGIREAKYAVPDDGKIDLIVVPALSIPRVIKHLKDMTTGDHIDKIKEIRKVLATDITITSDQLFRAETEGELLKFGNYHVEVIANALNVLTADY